MGSKGRAALAVFGAVTIALSGDARAADVRATLAVSAYVAVAGSIDVRTATAASSETSSSTPAQQTRHVAGDKVVAQKPTGESLPNCTAVTLTCTGPSAMRIQLRTDSDEIAQNEASSDICAARVRDNNVLLCNSSGASAPNVLGVVIDY